MATFTPPEGTDSGRPQIAYQVIQSPQGKPIAQWRSGKRAWKDFLPADYRMVFSGGETVLGNWLRSQGVRPLRGAPPRDLTAGTRVHLRARVSDRARRGIEAEARRQGISAGDYLTQHGESLHE